MQCSQAGESTRTSWDRPLLAPHWCLASILTSAHIPKWTLRNCNMMLTLIWHCVISYLLCDFEAFIKECTCCANWVQSVEQKLPKNPRFKKLGWRVIVCMRVMPPVMWIEMGWQEKTGTKRCIYGDSTQYLSELVRLDRGDISNALVAFYI